MENCALRLQSTTQVFLLSPEVTDVSLTVIVLPIAPIEIHSRQPSVVGRRSWMRLALRRRK